MISKLVEYKKRIRVFLRYLYYLNFPIGKKAYLLGTPLHNNIGDSAIVLAETSWLKKCGYKDSQIKELTLDEVQKNRKVITNVIRKNKKSCVYFHGGGNLGDQWINEEYFRRLMISELSLNSMLIFPQTIYYTDTTEGKIEEKKSIPFYNRKQEFVLIAREEESYKIMRSLYPDTKILLTPDIVLSTTKKDYNIKEKRRERILLCFRNDVEKKLKEKDVQYIKNIIKKTKYDYQRIDMYANRQVNKKNREQIVVQKMQEFAEAKLVITDRLHGMVFAAITETPCVVMSNYNHKVYGTYKWLAHLPYIRFAETCEESEKIILELLSMENEIEFDDSPFKSCFEQMKKVFKK